MQAEIAALRATPRENLCDDARARMIDNDKANAELRQIDAMISENKAILRSLREQRIRQVAIADYSMQLALAAESALLTKERA